MRRFFSLAAVLLVSSVLLAAQGVKEPAADETLCKVTAVTVSEDGTYRIETVRNGEIAIYLASEGTTETEEGYALSDISDGDYILVKDSGIMTMSLPPQIPATAIRNATPAVEAGLITPETATPAKMPGIVIQIGNVDTADTASAFNYSYGYLTMKSLMLQNLYPRAGYFARGVIDAANLQETTPLIAIDSMSASLDEFMAEVFSKNLPTDYGEIITDTESIMALPAPESLEDRFAYSYGYFTVLNLMYGGIEVIGEDFAAGLLTAIFDAEPILTTRQLVEAEV